MTDATNNRFYREPPEQMPPCDELGAVRDQLKALKEREAVLRDLMLSDPSARTGNKLIAELSDVTTQVVDLKELRANHPDLVAEFTFPRTTTKVELREVDPDTGEITRRRKKEQA
jgi:hypothetical protein